MTDFFRIEHVETGQGPYTSGYASYWSDWDEDRPNPVEDGLWTSRWDKQHVNEICGFVTMEAFRYWFTDDMLSVLAGDGESEFVLVHYSAPESAVRTGRRQSVAARGALTKVCVYELAEILENELTSV